MSTVTSKSPEPLSSPNNGHPHKISQRNATIILESATIIPSKQSANNNNNSSATKASKSGCKKSSMTSSPTTVNNKLIGADNQSSITTKNTHNSVNLKNLKNLSSKIAAIVPPVVDDGPSKTLLKEQLIHSNKGVEALGVLMQYLVYHVSNISFE